MAEPFRLVTPSMDHLPSYRAALEAGWSADNIRGAEAAREELASIAADALGFLATLDDVEAKGPPYVAPDGTVLQRIPSYRRWMWDGDFCGSIGFRWQTGTAALPPHILGHVGFTVVPWKRGNGYAAQALAALLPEARRLGLPYIEVTADEGNIASRRTIETCGGVLVERFKKVAAFGGGESLRYRITL